jgi:hypothetical protein
MVSVRQSESADNTSRAANVSLPLKEGAHRERQELQQTVIMWSNHYIQDWMCFVLPKVNWLKLTLFSQKYNMLNILVYAPYDEIRYIYIVELLTFLYSLIIVEHFE